MPHYRVILPAFTRIEEIHYVEAESEEQAIEAALIRDPDESVEDNEYYEVNRADARVTLKENV